LADNAENIKEKENDAQKWYKRDDSVTAGCVFIFYFFALTSSDSHSGVRVCQLQEQRFTRTPLFASPQGKEPAK